MKIILASQSKRRKEFLNNLGVTFSVMPATKEEKLDNNLSYAKNVENLSTQKAKEIFENTQGDRLIIGSDTIVVCDNRILGKPHNKQEAYDMLKFICNKTHTVFTGLCVIVERDGVIKKYIDSDFANVSICNLSDEMIKKYVETNESMDKAGAYALQGVGGNFITKVEGNPATIIGLPTNKLLNILLQEKIEILNFDNN